MNIVHYVVGRQTGKTTRLIQSVENSNADLIYVVGHKKSNVNELKNKIGAFDVKRIDFISLRTFNSFVYDVLNNLVTLDFNGSIEIYFDELHSMVCDDKTLKMKDVKKLVGMFDDQHHSNIIAFSTPMESYTLKEYTKFLNGESNYRLENGLLHHDYVSRKIFMDINLLTPIQDRKKDNRYNLDNIETFMSEFNGTYIKD